jgi:hypothetical protein
MQHKHETQSAVSFMFDPQRAARRPERQRPESRDPPVRILASGVHD